MQAAAYLLLIGHQVVSLDIWPSHLNLEFHHIHIPKNHHLLLHLHCIRVIAAIGKN